MKRILIATALCSLQACAAVPLTVVGIATSVGSTAAGTVIGNSIDAPKMSINWKAGSDYPLDVEGIPYDTEDQTDPTDLS